MTLLPKRSSSIGCAPRTTVTSSSASSPRSDGKNIAVSSTIVSLSRSTGDSASAARDVAAQRNALELFGGEVRRHRGRVGDADGGGGRRDALFVLARLEPRVRACDASELDRDRPRQRRQPRARERDVVLRPASARRASTCRARSSWRCAWSASRATSTVTVTFAAGASPTITRPVSAEDVMAACRGKVKEAGRGGRRRRVLSAPQRLECERLRRRFAVACERSE